MYVNKLVVQVNQGEKEKLSEIFMNIYLHSVI